MALDGVGKFVKASVGDGRVRQLPHAEVIDDQQRYGRQFRR